jgi:hypothetical protein
LRSKDFGEIKDLFSTICNKKVNLSKESQKSCILSPIDFRLSAYIMAICDNNYMQFSWVNNFNFLKKDRYLSLKE